MVESVNTVVNSNCFVTELQRLIADACTLHISTKLPIKLHISTKSFSNTMKVNI